MPKRKKVSKKSEDASAKRNKVEPKPVTLETNFQQGDLLFGLKGDLQTEHKKFLVDKYKYYRAIKLNNPAIFILLGKSKWVVDELSSEQKEHYAMLAKEKAYLGRDGGKNLPKDKQPHIIGAAIRRACKLLIWNASKTQRIHFEIGDMDQKRVCIKDNDDRGITNSEIRAAYRQTVRDGKNPYLFFYKNGVQTVPPWEDPQDKQYFDDYKTRIKKI